MASLLAAFLGFTMDVGPLHSPRRAACLFAQAADAVPRASKDHGSTAASQLLETMRNDESKLDQSKLEAQRPRQGLSPFSQFCHERSVTVAKQNGWGTQL
uniref:Uncharacterized protein n=1 Tax=Prymnesium polylepis TaxID=72548 RepID=A0A7S4HC86_9EUKA|mmetsp:Transcript_10108/g.24726  ORF Transcript_10108/g.24726 Transcript_10108/m.24726 type:complete len:100 (+) Transcript_10108:62-361(+)